LRGLSHSEDVGICSTEGADCGEWKDEGAEGLRQPSV
jgi:hypothetical protein